MTIFLTILHVIVCFILITVILLQAGRGQGLSGASFGSGNVQSVLGTRAADFLTKATTGAAICFLLTCISLDFIEARKSKSLLEVSNKTAPVDIDQIKEALAKVKDQMEAEKAGEAGALLDQAQSAVEDAAQQGEDVVVASAEALQDALPKS